MAQREHTTITIPTGSCVAIGLSPNPENMGYRQTTTAHWCFCIVHQAEAHHGGGDGPEDSNSDPDEGENLRGRHPIRPAALHLCLLLLRHGGTTGI